MKFQVALDFFELEKAIDLMRKIHSYVDIIEIGSPLMYSKGFLAVQKMKESFPEKMILADMKIVDGGYDIAMAAFKAGADIVTTIGMTNNETLQGIVRAAKEQKKFSMADMIGVLDLYSRAEELEGMGFDYLLLHTAHDTLGRISTPTEELALVRSHIHTSKIGISGGITLEKMKEICEIKPDWIVVGSGLIYDENPAELARKFKNYM